MGFFDFLFGKNPSKEAMNYYNQIPGQAQQYYQPYMNAGQNALGLGEEQYKDLLNNPGGKLNEIGKGFQESPGFKFALDQALQSGSQAQAAGGMAGSPQHEQYAMQLATQLGNQDYNNWLGQATGLYNQGLQGNQNLIQGGQQASGSMADLIAQSLAQQGNLAFRGQQDQNSSMGSFFGGLGRGIGALGAFTPWGQAGGAFDTAYKRLFPNG